VAGGANRSSQDRNSRERATTILKDEGKHRNMGASADMVNRNNHDNYTIKVSQVKDNK